MLLLMRTMTLSLDVLNSQMLSDLVPNIADYTVLTCGPESYMSDLRAMTESLGIPSERFF